MELPGTSSGSISSMGVSLKHTGGTPVLLDEDIARRKSEKMGVQQKDLSQRRHSTGHGPERSRRAKQQRSAKILEQVEFAFLCALAPWREAFHLLKVSNGKEQNPD